MSASLSFSAEQLLGALERLVVGEAPVERWLVALARHDRALVDSEGAGLDVDALLASDPGEGAELLTRADVGALASRLATDDGREVAGTSDVAAALVAAVAPPPETTAPESPAEAIERDVPIPDRPPPEDLPLSFAAEQLLASLRAKGSGLHELLVTLADEHDDLLDAAGVDVDVSAVAAGALLRLEAGDAGVRWDADRLTAKASAQAHAAGRAVMAPKDVAAALLLAGADAFPTEPKDGRPEPPDRQAAKTEAVEPEEPPTEVEPAVEAGKAAPPPEPVQLPEPEPVAAGEEPEPEPVAAGEEPEHLELTGGRPRIFRVFVSSTFKDLEAERNVLRERVYPELSRFCAERGARFQPIDLRWGVSEEASLDQQAMSICLDEIDRCREVTPRPNFLVLLGNRYGWLALPPQIPKTQFDEICERVHDGDDDRNFLKRWYQLDENATPSEYRLRPRAGDRAPSGHPELPPRTGDVESAKAVRARREAEKQEQNAWQLAESRLRQILTAAVGELGLDEEARRVFETSATEQEIRAGALDIGAAEGRAFCFRREISLTPDDPLPGDVAEGDRILDFIDPELAEPEGEAHRRLTRLKEELLPFTVDRSGDYPPSGGDTVSYRARWRRPVPTDAEAALPITDLDAGNRAQKALTEAGVATIGDLIGMSASELDEVPGIGDASVGRVRDALDKRGLGLQGETERPTTDHLDEFARNVLTTLKGAISQEIRHPSPPPQVQQRKVRIQPDVDLDGEQEAHRDFAESRIQHFVGRVELLEQIDAYLSAGDNAPLVVHGDGGTGKSALLAKALHDAQTHPGAQLVYRFIGATPDSADGRALLESICRDLARSYDTDETTVPSDFQDLTADFRKRLESATASRPLLLFIDSLDQLAGGHGARRLTWIPHQLPSHVRLVVSTRPGDTFDPLRTRLEAAGTGPNRLLEVGSMSRDDGRALLKLWRDDTHRALQPAQREWVLDAFESARGNPLYLQLAFEEARRWISTQQPEHLHLGRPGDEEDRRHPKDVEAIIEHNTFARLAREDNHGDVLVRHALGYLAASRYGLAEDELLDLLSRDPDVYAWFLLTSFHVPLDLRDRLRNYLTDDDKKELRARAVERDSVERDEARERGEDIAPPLQPGQVDVVGEWVRQLRDGERNREQLITFVNQAGTKRREGLRVPVVLWSRLAADLRPYLTERVSEGSVLIAFYHRELDDVATATFLENDGMGPTLHSRLADYFRAKANPHDDHTWTTDGEHVDRRGLSELPYHLTHAQRWDDVHDTLTDFVFLEQKVAKVAVTTRREGDEETEVYRGVFQLQDDFDTALRRMPGGEGEDDRRRIIVTAVDLGEGLVIRCPHCNAVHAFEKTCPHCKVVHDLDGWRGEEVACPNKNCNGPLKVNEFVVERSAT